MSSRLTKLFSILFICLIAVSCSFDFGDDVNNFTDSFVGLSLRRNDPTVVSCNDSTFTINVVLEDGDYTYQWYKCDIDKSNAQKLENMTSANLTYNAPESRTVEYFYCEVTKGTHKEETAVFPVAKTGLALLQINTKDETPVLSKDDVEGDTMSLSSSSDTVLDLDGVPKSKNTDSSKVESVSCRGNFSFYNAFGKKSYNLKLAKLEKTEDSDKGKRKLLNYEGSKKSRKWVVTANANDHSFIKNWFASRFATVINQEADYSFESNRWTPQNDFVDLVLNGEYLGLYSLYEKIRLDDGRIEDGNYIFEVQLGSGDFKGNKSDWYYTFCDPETADLTDGEITGIKEKIYQIEDLIYSTDHTAADYASLKSLIDVQSLIDYFLVKEFVQEYDGYVRSVYMWWNPTESKMYFGPIWDCDSCAKSDYDEWYLVDRTWISELLKYDSFVDEMQNRWDEISATVKTIINDELPVVCEYIDVSVQMNGVKWSNLVTYDQWKASAEEFQSWLKKRYTWFDSAIDNL